MVNGALAFLGIGEGLNNTQEAGRSCAGGSPIVALKF